MLISLLDDRRLDYFETKFNGRGFTTTKGGPKLVRYAPALFGLAPRLLMNVAESYGSTLQ